MVMLLRLLQGVWTKTAIGDWRFESSSVYLGETLLVRENETYEDLTNMVRARLMATNPPPPFTIRTNNDVEVMTSVRVYDPDPTLNVTFGPQNVAKYQFHCRSPFTVGSMTFLGDRTTKVQHRHTIRDLVGGDPIRCAKSVLELLFDEQQLIIVYRMAMEIDTALAWDDDIQHPPPQLPYQTLPLQGPNNHAHRVLPLHPFNNVTETQHPSFDSQPLNPISPDHSSDIFRGASLDIERGRGLPRLPNAWGETSDDDDDFWDGMHDDPIPPPPQPRPTQGLLSLPQPAKPCQMTARATVTLLSDGDSFGSQTGSSDGLIADITHIRTPSLLGIPVHSPHRPVGGGKFEQGSGTSNAPALPKRNLLQSFMQGSGSGSGPSLDLRLGLDTDNKNGSGSSYVNLGDSSSDTDENDGGFGPTQ
ncbi:unnamed protein product [Brassica napus]|uniref:(rape) hypothetical protein n=1 Tax=Brassica napus TaxID=3708 RepID=A0A816TCP8_BRANA|nr:unnamed protein product [Brassica napus]